MFIMQLLKSQCDFSSLFFQHVGLCQLTFRFFFYLSRVRRGVGGDPVDLGDGAPALRQAGTRGEKGPSQDSAPQAEAAPAGLMARPALVSSSQKQT